jgi:signal transduction histidine kinase
LSLATLGVFGFDLLIPLGVAAGVPYVAVVLIAAWIPWRHSIVLFAVVGSALTLLGYLLSEPGGVAWMVAMNRGLALFAIWVTALLLVQRRRAEERLKAARDGLEARVKERTWELEQANADLQRQIAGREKAEEALRQAQKMEAVGQLTGGIAHDFNNLLAVILGNAELLHDKIGGDPFITQIDRAATRGAELTQRLLAFSRQQALQPQSIDLTELLPSLDDLLRRTLGEPVKLLLDLPEGVWPVTADPGQLENALLNLAINARDAMPHGGNLEIRCENVQLRNGELGNSGKIAAGDYVRIAVCDTGAGMPADVLEHAFEPFYTTKDVGEGSGLGLSMVYGFVRQSGGDVAIDSEPGLGSEIKMFLPRAKIAATPSDQSDFGHDLANSQAEAIRLAT